MRRAITSAGADSKRGTRRLPGDAPTTHAGTVHLQHEWVQLAFPAGHTHTFTLRSGRRQRASFKSGVQNDRYEEMGVGDGEASVRSAADGLQDGGDACTRRREAGRDGHGSVGGVVIEFYRHSWKEVNGVCRKGVSNSNGGRGRWRVALPASCLAGPELGQTRLARCASSAGARIRGFPGPLRAPLVRGAPNRYAAPEWTGA